MLVQGIIALVIGLVHVYFLHKNKPAGKSTPPREKQPVQLARQA